MVAIASAAPVRLSGWHVVSVVVAYTLLYSGNGVITSASQVGGKYLYNPVSISFVVSAVKLIFSVSALWWTGRLPTVSQLEAVPREERRLFLKDTLKFGYPGLVYLVDDNLYFAVLHYLTPGEATLYSNVKVLTTAVALRLMLHKAVSKLQWSALCTLALGLTVSKTAAASFTAFSPGHVLIVLISVIGSTGDVYNEKLLKASPATSIHLQNARLYLFSVVFNFVTMVAYHRRYAPAGKGSPYLHGWGWLQVLLVCVGAAQGLSLSVIFKFLDNIVKVEANAAGMVVTVLVSAVFFDRSLATGFYLGVGVVLNALFVYNYENMQAAAAAAAVRASAPDDGGVGGDAEGLLPERLVGPSSAVHLPVVAAAAATSSAGGRCRDTAHLLSSEPPESSAQVLGAQGVAGL